MQLIPDREPALAATADIRRTYDRDGFGRAMVKFFAISSWKGEIPAGFADRSGGAHPTFFRSEVAPKRWRPLEDLADQVAGETGRATETHQLGSMGRLSWRP